MKPLIAFATLGCAIALAGVRANCALPATPDAPTVPTVPSPAAVQDSGASGATSGVWLMTWTNKEQEIRHATLQLQQNGEGLSGTAKLEGGPIKGSYPLTGSVQGNRVSFSVKVYGRHVSFAGTVDGKKMSGTTKEGAPWLAAQQ